MLCIVGLKLHETDWDPTQAFIKSLERDGVKLQFSQIPLHTRDSAFKMTACTVEGKF